MRASSWLALLMIVVVQLVPMPSIGGHDWSQLPAKILALISTDFAPPNPAVDVDADDAPSPDLQQIVDPIRSKLSGDRDRARKVAAAFAGYAEAMAGPIGERIETTGQWGHVVAAATESIDVSGKVPVADEIRSAVVTHVDIEPDPDNPSLNVDRPLTDRDRERIAEVYRAISWAARRAAGGG